MTSTYAPPPGTTVVKNRLQYPTGEPRSGERVDVLVRAVTDWREDHTGRIVSTANTWTNADGCWRLPLLPYTVYDAGRNTIVEVREGGLTSGYIQVPPPSEGAERWMRDLLVSNPVPTNPWQPISRLADLHDVDHASINAAPDGSVLIKRNGKWRAVEPELRTLRDIDESVTWAHPFDDSLTYLGASRGWGVNRDRPSTIKIANWYYDADGRTIWVPVTDFERDKTPYIFWNDDTEDTPLPEPEEYSHTFTTSGTYHPSVYYPNDPDPGVDLDDHGGPVVIPKPPQAASREG